MKNIFLFGFCLLFILVSCNKENILSEDNTMHSTETTSRGGLSGNVFTYTNYYQTSDLNFSNLSMVVDDMVQSNSDFRDLVLSEALQEFDGDYDILVSDFIQKKIPAWDTSGNPQGMTTVGNLMNETFQKLDFTVSSIGANQDYMGDYPTDDLPMQQLVYLYPALNFAVPVNIDLWEGDMIPPVTFVPENFNEGDTQSLTAFQNSNTIVLDAEVEPRFPVIVVGHNERAHMKFVVFTEPPVVDINLSGEATEFGIRLNWDFSTSENEIQGYHIFRKKAGQENFVHIGDSPGEDNKTFDDLSVTALQTFSYFVKAFNQFGSSMSSNIVNVAAPDFPLAAAEFDAFHYEKDKNELRWAHMPGNYVDSTIISKRVISVDNDYIIIHTADTQEDTFIHDISEYGKTVSYKLEEVNNLGQSTPKFEIIKLPYRDISQLSPVNISTISYLDVREIEAWIYGKPEFRISVASGSSDGTGKIVEKGIDIKFKYRKQENDVFPLDNYSNSEPHPNFISNWVPSDFMESYTFNAIEVDNAPKIDVNLSTGFEVKNESKTGFIKGSVSVLFEDILNSKDEELGSAECSYYEPTDFVLEFAQSEFQIKLK